MSWSGLFVAGNVVTWIGAGVCFYAEDKPWMCMVSVCYAIAAIGIWMAGTQ